MLQRILLKKGSLTVFHALHIVSHELHQLHLLFFCRKGTELSNTIFKMEKS
jgi:hypothetical protein